MGTVNEDFNYLLSFKWSIGLFTGTVTPWDIVHLVVLEHLQKTPPSYVDKKGQRSDFKD